MRRWLVLGVILLLGAGAALAQDEDVTTLLIPPLDLQPGESQMIEVGIDCMADGCSAFDLTMTFDPQVFQVDELEIGPYLGEDVFVVEDKIDNDAGTLRLAAAALGDLPEAGDDDHVLLRIHITALAGGPSTFTVTRVDIGDLVGSPVEVEIAEPEVVATPTPIITVPPPSTPEPEPVTCEYTVRSGDTMGGIATANGVTVEAIMELNEITDARFIYVGQKLRVPSTTCVSGLSARSGSSGSTQSGTRYIEVWDCRHLGSNVFEWYGVEITYDSAGNAASSRHVDGPHTGPWQPNCPAGEQSSSSGRSGGSSDDGGSGGGSSGGGGGRPPV